MTSYDVILPQEYLACISASYYANTNPLLKALIVQASNDCHQLVCVIGWAWPQQRESHDLLSKSPDHPSMEGSHEMREIVTCTYFRMLST